MRNFILALLFVALALGEIALAQVKPVGEQCQVKQVIVELFAENLNHRIAVPVDTLQAVGGVSAGVTEGGLNRTNWGYSFSVYRIEKNRVFLRMRVNTNSGERVEKRFSVSRAGASEYQFERGIKVKAYYERVGQSAQELSARVDGYLNAKVKANQFSGSILIAQDGKVLVSKGYGMANAELDVPNTPQTKFRIGSLTKPFTATAIMILQERGKLSVQDSICKYVSQCPSAWQPIKVHHLLTHTSGIPDVSRLPEFETLVLLPTATESIIERFKNKPLESKPGEKFSYNNGGYLLLGYIIERASGKTYEAFLQEAIFQPLKMTSSGVDRNDSILKNRASGYARQDNVTVNAPFIYISNLQGGGSLYSTVEDMFLWNQAFNSETLLSKKSLDVVFSPLITTPFDASYGYGWFVYKDKSNRRAFGHTGGINGFRSNISRFADEKLFVVVLSNLNVAPVDDIANDLAEMAFNQNNSLK